MNLLSHFNSFKAGQEGPSEPAAHADPFGLASWSSHAGTTEHAAAMQMAAMLAGIAGPVVELDDGEVPRPMGPFVPVLVTSGGRRPRSLEALCSVPLEMDSQLRRRFAGFSPEGLREAFELMPRKGERFNEAASTKDRLQEMLKALDPGDGMGANDSYASDFEPDVHDRRLRTVLRPGFILENPVIAKLPGLVATCHDSTALLPGFQLEHLLRGGTHAFDEFFALVAGRDLDLPTRVTGNSLTKSERGVIRCILTAKPGEIADAVAAYPSFSDWVVLVDSSRPAIPGVWDERQVAIFHHVFNRQVQYVADQRRRGHYLDFRLWSPEGRRARLNNQAAFLNACDAAKVSCAGLEDVPAILRWAFDLIERKDTPLHEELAEIIHRLCLALLDDHVRLLGDAQQRATRIGQLELAEKLVGRISARQPVRQRDLIRTFDIQKVERYRPVLDLLVEEGVLVEEPRHVFRLGARKLESLRNRWLADPILLS